MMVLLIMAPQSSPKKKVEKKGRKLEFQNFPLSKFSSVDSYYGFLSLQEWET